MTTGQQAADYCRHICQFASAQNIGLAMHKTPDGWTWEWEGHGAGTTTAHTQQVALFHACQFLEDRLLMAKMEAQP